MSNVLQNNLYCCLNILAYLGDILALLYVFGTDFYTRASDALAELRRADTEEVGDFIRY